MADNLEKSGLELVTPGAEKAISNLDKFNKESDKTTRSVEKLAAASSGINLDKVTSGATSAANAVGGLGSAGSAAGAGVAAGAAVASAALLGIVAVAGAVISAVGAIGNAIGQAISYANSIHSVQNSTGLGAGAAQSLSAGADVTGNSASAVGGTFNAITKNAENMGNAADKAFGKMGAAADKADTRLKRLNEDYARSIADITTSAAERIQASNDALVESHAAMLQRQARADEDYAREVSDGRAALAQRLADIDASANASIAALTQRQTRASDDYARETENARRDLAQSVLDIEQGLADSVEALQYRAAEQNVAAIDDGAQAQAKIQEDLQKKLYDIEQKYSSKRQSLQEKIYDPNTNPILRAFYKTQLKSIDGLQKAEEDGARSGAAAKEAAQRRETEARLAEIARGLAREEALEREQAQRRIQRQQQEAAQQQAERLRQFTQQSGDLAAQIAVENAQRRQQSDRARADLAAREADLRRSYDRQASDAQAAYDKQVADAAVAQAKIQAETQKRLDAEKRQYDRAIEDINTSLANVGGGGSVAAAGLNQAAEGFAKLGITAEAWQKLSPDEKLKLLNDRIHELVAGGDTEGAITMVMRLANVSREAAANLVDASIGAGLVDEQLKAWGLTQEQIDALRKAGIEFETVKEAVKLLVIQIGVAFLPVFETMIAKFQSFWKDHGPEVVTAIKNIGKWIITDAIPAIIKIGGEVIKFVSGFIEGFNKVDKACRDISTAIGQSGIAIHDVAVSINNGIRDFVLSIFDDFKTKIDNVITFIGFLKTKFDEFITGIGRAQLPSWLQPGGAGLTPNVTYPPSYNNGFRPQSVPATGAQMAASNVTSSKTTNTNSAVINISVANGTKANVEGGVSSALFKAGFTVTK